MQKNGANDATPWLATVPLSKVAQAVGVALVVVIGFVLLMMLRGVIAALFLGILLAVAIQPLVSRMSRLGLPLWVAAGLGVAGVVGASVAFVLVLTPLLIENLNSFITQLPQLYTQTNEWLAASPSPFLRQIGAYLQARGPDPEVELTLPLTQLALTGLSMLGGLTFHVLSVFAVTYFWLLYRDRSIQEVLLLFPLDRRETAKAFWGRIEASIADFVVSQVWLGLSVAGLSLLGYWLAQTPYPLLLALVAGIMEIVPLIGPLITTVVAGIIGLSVSPTVAVSAVIVGLIVQQLENNLLVPRIMSNTMGIHPVISILVFIGAAALIGPVGAILAVPLAAIIQLIFSAWLSYRSETVVKQGVEGRGQVDRLRYQGRELAQDLSRYMRAKSEELEGEGDETEEELERLLADFDTFLAPPNGQVAQEPNPPSAG